MDKELRDILENGKDWEKVRTTTSGVWICKMPGKGTTPPSLAVVVNPADSSGKPKKKRDLFIRSPGDLNEFRKIICSDKILEILEAIEKINPEAGREEKIIDI